MVFSLKNMLRGNGGGLSGFPQFKRVQAPVQSGGFPTQYTKTDLWAVTGSDITLSATSYVRIGEKSIPVQQKVYLGHGVSGGNPEEIGHLHFDLMDDTATNSVAEKGTVRIGYANANETLTAVMWEARTEELSDASTSSGITRPNERLLPEMPPSAKGYPDELAQENSIIFIDMKADAVDILVETAIGTGAVNVWRLPITVYQ